MNIDKLDLIRPISAL